MIADSRAIEEGITVEIDVCIIGAGAAFLALALEFWSISIN
jgi:NADPH-dependent 2,4-dienoyl-CoA reductase/sulfur reductase-like enzyme